MLLWHTLIVLPAAPHTPAVWQRSRYLDCAERGGAGAGAGPLWQEFIAYLQAPRSGTPAYQALFGGGPPGQEDAQRTMLLR